MKPSVSIVYTEISVLQTLDKILTAGGFQTYPYYSPEEALAWAQFRHPDIYLINYKNIHLNGVEFYQKLQETTDYYKLDLKAVFISSKPEVEQECREVGGLDFIHLPFESKKVVEIMLKWSRVGNSIN